MKTKITKVFTAFLAVALIILSSIPFASAAELLNTEKAVSLTLNCSKPGYTFTVYKVATLDHTTSSTYETKYTSLVSEIDSSVLDGETADILEALDNVDTLPSAATVVGTFTSSATEITKTISGLAQGIYYVRATNFPAGVKSVTNSVVALPYFDGDEWQYSIPAINLAEKVVDDKSITEKTITNSTKNNKNYTDVSLGDTIEFEIRSTTAGSAKMKLSAYAVYDDMSAGLTLNKNSFNVALLKKDGTKITDLDNSEYTVTITSEGEGKNTLFNVALTNAYLQLDEFYGSDVYYTSVTYSAVLNKYAVVGTAGNPNTEQELSYSNKNGVTDKIEGNTVYVYTYAVTNNKYDETGKTPLAGAEFALYLTEEDATAQINEIAAGVSDENGRVTYYNGKGEEIRLQSGTYYIVETAAPKGYNLYGSVITVDINAEYGQTLVNGTYVTNCPKDGYATFDVCDNKIVLPQTGGFGTHIFYIIGIGSLVAGAALLFVRKKVKAHK